MSNATDDGNRMKGYLRSAEAIADVVFDHFHILAVLPDLRRLGGDANDIVDRIIDLQEFRKLRLSWELLSALASGDGLDAEAMLLEHLDVSDVDVVREALWGGPPTDGRHLRLVTE